MFSSTKIMQALSPAAAVPSGYQISRSLRFNSADSAYLNRTPGTAGNGQKFTISAWVKKSKNDATQTLYSAFSGAGNTDTTVFHIYMDGSNSTLQITGAVAGVTSTPVFRDVSAWYHVVVSVDTTQSGATNQMKLYINGVQQTVSGTAYTVNTTTPVNQAVAQTIGRRSSVADRYIDGYLTEYYMIDGQALTPSSFGETDATTGVWTPKAYTGTYGTNGFYLNFSDNSGTTATTLGKDSSGNGNNWTPNNFSVTAGVGNDSLVDSPTNYGTDTGVGGEVRGNYCTMNAIATLPTGVTNMPNFLNGNLDITGKGTAATWYDGAQSTFIFTAGKYYWETTINAIGGGVDLALIAQNSYTSANRIYRSGGNKVINGTSTAYGASFTTGDVIGFAADFDGGTLTCYKNGTSQGTLCSDLASALPSAGWSINPQVAVSGSVSLNFGQRPFAYTAPSGFKALCTTNLSTPAIVKPNTNFETVIWTGNSSQITVGFDPDVLWYKARNAVSFGGVVNSITGDNVYLQTYTTGAESTSAGLVVTNSTGFVPGTVFSTNNYVAWNWKANGAGSSNTSGTITSTVSANTTAGISVVTWTDPTSGTSYTIGHGLGATPAMIIFKYRAQVSNWLVYHKSIASGSYCYLNTTAAATAISGAVSALSSTTITIGTYYVDNPAQNLIAYCFAEVAGFSKFGSYTGNGSADGTFVYCGFRPRWIMIKRTDSTGDWNMIDTTRNPYNVVDLYLYANTSAVEGTYSGYDILSNGFKLRNTGTNINASGGTYIFAAFAEAPFNYSRAR